MLTRQEVDEARKKAVEYLEKAGVVLRDDEKSSIEVADLGLGNLQSTGVEILVYVNNERYCAKEIILFPGQTSPEHKHERVGDDPGKQETFRCRWGEGYLYVPGDPTPNPKATPPAGREQHYTVWHEIILRPGVQYTLPPGTLHWIQGGPDGLVATEFSSTSRDEYDIFTDPDIKRIPEIAD